METGAGPSGREMVASEKADGQAFRGHKRGHLLPGHPEQIGIIRSVLLKKKNKKNLLELLFGGNRTFEP